MGKRLARIATRTGDDGTTGLGNAARVDKDSDRIEALGDIDELNSTLGALIDEFNRALPPLQEFILPGGCRADAILLFIFSRAINRAAGAPETCRRSKRMASA